jgi:putative ABC transport system permease protein
MIVTGLYHEAWVSIAASRLRTFLAMLGIVIGVGSVILMLAVGAGSRATVQAAIDKLGTNLIIITPGSREVKGVTTSTVSDLTVGDANAIGQLETVIDSAPATQGREFQISLGNTNMNTRVTGTTSSFFPIRAWTFAGGNNFTEEEERLGKRVAVIGATIAAGLFQGEDAIGRNFRINGIPFTVVGILEPKGQGFDGRDQDDTIIIPLNTARSKLWGYNFSEGIVQYIFAEAASKEEVEIAFDDIANLLRERHKLRETEPDDFSIRNLSSIAQVATDTTKALSILLGAIASISLVVGGIGIMNIMLVTVTERTREIGIRKAIGATKNSILIQFLMEAILIAGAGSFIGFISGIGFGIAAEHWGGITVQFSMWSVVLSLGVAIGVGITSGLYPAFKAAHMEPIEALRNVGG